MFLIVTLLISSKIEIGTAKEIQLQVIASEKSNVIWHKHSQQTYSYGYCRQGVLEGR